MDKIIIQTSRQKMAKKTWECINELKLKSNVNGDNFLSVARGFPALLQNSGLCQSLSFLLAKGNGVDNFHDLYLKCLLKSAEIEKEPLNYIQEIQNNSTLDYLIETQKIMATSEWIKRYSEIQFKEV